MQRLRITRAIWFPFVLLAVVAWGCSDAGSIEPDRPMAAAGGQFGDYWYQGKAELNRYELEQARYGELHKGEAVLIFVTEDFLTDKQVKFERGDGTKAVSILKLNSARKFYTGIYPYSNLTSVFTPVDQKKHPQSLKISTTVQEWCGHVYSQLNLRDGSYRGISHSYFQEEADQQFDLKAALLEDEIWTRIRLAPGSLPTGNIELIPDLQFIRLRHLKFEVQKATAELKTAVGSKLSKNPVMEYSVSYKDINRKVRIFFEKTFPHEILSWEEEITSGWGPGAKTLTTRAVRTHKVITDYWSKNSVADADYRNQLGLQ